MKYNLFFSLMVAVLVSLVTSKIVYFGFTPNYAADIFSRNTFNGRFDHDVYKYRILCKYLLFAVDDWLGQDMPAKGAEPRILINTRDGSERFYIAFYYLNTFFLVLTSVMVVLLLDLDRKFRFGEGEKTLIIFLVPVLICLSQFTVCCYDVSSFFFQLLILYIFLRFGDKYFWASVSAISVLLILSTMNRESSALSVSLTVLLLITRYGLIRKVFFASGLLALCFLLTYAALHILIVDPSHQRIINTQAGQLLIDTNLIGLFFWGLFFYLPMVIACTAENRWLIAAFFLLSFPYIYTCFTDGVLWEIRLYIPLFLGALFLSKLNVSTHVIRLSGLTLRMFRREIQ